LRERVADTGGKVVYICVCITFTNICICMLYTNRRDCVSHIVFRLYTYVYAELGCIHMCIYVVYMCLYVVYMCLYVVYICVFLQLDYTHMCIWFVYMCVCL